MATMSSRLPYVRSRVRLIPILDAYLLHELIGPFLFAFSAYLLFWGLNILFLSADYIINQHAPFFLVLRFVVLRVPQAIPMAFPFGTLFATLLAMGRIMADNELTAMRTAGVPILRIAITPLAFGIVMFLIAYGMNEWVTPRSVDLSTRTFYQMLYHTNSLPVEPQFFRKDPDTGDVFYVTQVAADGKTMVGVQIFKPARFGPWVETLQAKTAVVQGTSLVLYDVIDTRFNNDGLVSSQQHVHSVSVGLPLQETAAQFLSAANSDPYTMTSKQLAQQVRLLQSQGIGGTALGTLQLTLANKLAWPFACVIGVALAFPLAIRFGKRGRMLGIALSVVALLVYYLLMSAASAFGRNGAINPYIASWIPNIVMGLAGGLLLWLEER